MSSVAEGLNTRFSFTQLLSCWSFQRTKLVFPFISWVPQVSPTGRHTEDRLSSKFIQGHFGTRGFH